MSTQPERQPKITPAVSLNQTAAVYTLDETVLVLWKHQGSLDKRVNLTLDGETLVKPYIGARVTDEIAAFATRRLSVPGGQTVTLSVSDSQGATVFATEEAALRPMQALRTDIGDSNVFRHLIERVVKRAPGNIVGWTAEHGRQLSSLLPQRVRAAPRNALTTHTPGRLIKAASVGTVRIGIDTIDGRRIRGWAINTAAMSKVLELDFFVNREYAGSARADNPRFDIGLPDKYRHHGFEINLRRSAFGSRWREAHLLEIRDNETEVVLLERCPMHYRSNQEEREHSTLAWQLDRIEQAIQEIQLQLPAIRRRSAYELSDYDLWFEQVHALDCERPPEPSCSTPTVPKVTIIIPIDATVAPAVLDRVLASTVPQAEKHAIIVLNRAETNPAFEALFNRYRSGRGPMVWLDAFQRPTDDFLRVIGQFASDGYCLFLQPGECLSPTALEIMATTMASTGGRLFYADSDCLADDDRHEAPELRPDFNLDLLLSTPYIGAFGIQIKVMLDLAEQIADLPDAAWQYDLLLRASEAIPAKDWTHITRVLSHVQVEGQRQLDDQRRAQFVRVVQDYLKRNALPAEAVLDTELYAQNPELPRTRNYTAMRLHWRIPAPSPTVSIIVPTRDGKALVTNCLESIQRLTDYPNYEVLIVDNDSTDAELIRWFDSLDGKDGVRVVNYQGEFNWSALNNLAASEAGGDLLCFLNDDTEVIGSNWLIELVSHSCRPDVGVVGAKLLYPDRTLQHGGIVVGAHGVAEHAFTGLDAEKPGYMLRAAVTQNLSAVTGACLVCRRDVFDAVGGFEMVHLGVAFNDVDFCLRVIDAGYRVVWTPHARLYHLAGRSRGQDLAGAQRERLDREIGYMKSTWSEKLQRDPCYNSAFESNAHPYSMFTSRTYAVHSRA